MKYNYKDKQREINLPKEDFQSALELLLKIDSHLDKYKDKGLVTEIKNILKYGTPEKPRQPLSQKEMDLVFDQIFPIGTILTPIDNKPPKVVETFGVWEKLVVARYKILGDEHEVFYYKRVK